MQVLWTYDELGGKLNKENFGECLKQAKRLGHVVKIGTSGIFTQQLADCGAFVKANEVTGTVDGTPWMSMSEQLVGGTGLVVEVARREPSTETGSEYGDFCTDLLDNYRDELTDWEINFLEDNAQRAERYGSRTMFSDAQIRMIDKIRDKVGA